MAKTPVEGTITASNQAAKAQLVSELLLIIIISGHWVTVLTFALVNEKTTGSSEVNSVVDLEALQVLTHLPTLWEFRVNVFKVNLSTRNNRRN